jgi:hypothetical protein
MTHVRAATIGLTALLALAAVSPVAHAQIGSGQIEGTVKDEQGGVLPGVTLSVRNQETGVTRTFVTEVDGSIAWYERHFERGAATRLTP